MSINLSIQRFRPNLVISQCEPYAEDTWREITINSIGFRLPKACSRCSIPSINLNTAIPDKEPSKILSQQRKWNKEVYFGQNALHNATGTLITGNPVTINRTGPTQPPMPPQSTLRK